MLINKATIINTALWQKKWRNMYGYTYQGKNDLKWNNAIVNWN